MLILVVVHVLGVLLMCALQKENLVRAMITGQKARTRRMSRNYFAVAFSRNFTSASRSSAEPMVCSGILVPGV